MDKVRKAAVERGRRAWARIKAEPRYATWSDWTTVGEALAIGREHCTRIAGGSSGKGYNKEITPWLRANGFGEIDKAVRSRLSDLMENRAAVEAWRAGLEMHQRQRTNHPTQLWRNWRGR